MTTVRFTRRWLAVVAGLLLGFALLSGGAALVTEADPLPYVAAATVGGVAASSMRRSTARRARPGTGAGWVTGWLAAFSRRRRSVHVFVPLEPWHPAFTGRAPPFVV